MNSVIVDLQVCAVFASWMNILDWGNFQVLWTLIICFVEEKWRASEEDWNVSDRKCGWHKWGLVWFVSINSVYFTFLFILMCQPCKLLEIFKVQIVCLTLLLLLAANEKKKNMQKFQVSFCKIHRNGYIALARVLPKRFDFNGNTIGFCPKF